MLNINYVTEPLVITKVEVKLEDIIGCERVADIEDKFLESVQNGYYDYDPEDYTKERLLSSNITVEGNNLVLEYNAYDDDFNVIEKLANMKVKFSNVLFTELGLPVTPQIMITKTQLVDVNDFDYVEGEDCDDLGVKVVVSIKMTPDYYQDFWLPNEVERYTSPETLEEVGGQKIEPVTVTKEEVDKINEIENQYLTKLFDDLGTVSCELTNAEKGQCECDCKVCKYSESDDEKTLEVFETIINKCADGMGVPREMIREPLEDGNFARTILNLFTDAQDKELEKAIKTFEANIPEEVVANAVIYKYNYEKHCYIDEDGNDHKVSEVMRLKAEDELRQEEIAEMKESEEDTFESEETDEEREDRLVDEDIQSDYENELLDKETKFETHETKDEEYSYPDYDYELPACNEGPNSIYGDDDPRL